MPLDLPASALDPLRHRMIAVGNSPVSGTLEAWSLPLVTPGAAWQKLSVSGSPPGTPRVDMKLIYDPRRDRMLFIGAPPGNAARNDVWQLTLGASPAWTVLNSPVTFGIRSFYESMIYDPVRDRLVAFGGRDNSGRTLGTLNNQVSVLSLASLTSSTPWTTLTFPGPAPVARDGHMAIYDAVNDGMILFGGNAATGPVADAWSLSFGDSLGVHGGWTRVAPSGVVPSNSVFASVVLDSARRRIVVFGGANGDDTPPLIAQPFHPAVGDVRVLSLGPYPAWTALSPDGVLPGPMQRQAAIYDPDNDRMVVTNGWGNAANDSMTVNRHDTFALSFAAGDWLDLSVLPVDGGAITRSPDHDCVDPGATVTLTATPASGFAFVRWLGAPGDDTTNPLTFTADQSRAITAVFRDFTAVPGAPGSVTVTDLMLSPNPVRGALRLDYALARAGRATVAVYDLSGREVARLVDGAQTIGRQSVTWRAASRAGLAPGVYLVRLTAPDCTITRRVVALR